MIHAWIIAAQEWRRGRRVGVESLSPWVNGLSMLFPSRYRQISRVLLFARLSRRVQCLCCGERIPPRAAETTKIECPSCAIPYSHGG
jgi:hypothetical protein